MKLSEELLQKIIKKWGIQRQFDQAEEECAELIVSIKHFFRNRVESEDVMEEMADVEIMIECLLYVFSLEDPDARQKYQNKLAEKTSKMLKQLGAE